MKTSAVRPYPTKSIARDSQSVTQAKTHMEQIILRFHFRGGYYTSVSIINIFYGNAFLHEEIHMSDHCFMYHLNRSDETV